MQVIESVEQLKSLYADVPQGAIDKVCDHITPLYQRWIAASRFVVLATVGPEGTDASPRGDSGEVVYLKDAKTIWMPDWRGNNRLDSLANIVRDGRVSLMFMVPGSQTVVRVNGTGVVTADGQVTDHFQRQGASATPNQESEQDPSQRPTQTPRTVIVIKVAEVYFQCAKALMRSRLWTAGDESTSLPTAGELLAESLQGFDAKTYDEGFPQRAKDQLW
jgi:predicted pyridoxine 5'-phosphate oxidase superfamily flavin-nucleotide-binding protein